jgi:O-antigen/teichoic acid export membrane protein
VLKNLRLNTTEIFQNNASGHGLKNTIVKGSVSLVISQGIGFGLSMINTIVLARLLLPDDFGVIGMVTVFINFLIMFKDAGLSTATIQNESIDSKQISTLFWINAIISLGLGIAILISSPLVAAFYKKPELTAVTAVLSLSFIIQGFAIQHNALLQRHIKFTAIAINDIIAQICSIAIAIALASVGLRYWALVAGTLVRSATLVALTFYSCPWIPGKMQRGTGVREMIKFGGHLTAGGIVNYFARNLDSLLIGRLVGAGPLGLYSRAFSLLMTPLTQIRAPLTTMSLPILSTLKSEPTRYLSYFKKLLDISVSLALPISVYSFLEGEFLIRVLLGENWMEAVPVFKILAIAGVFIATSGAPGLVMLSHGFSKRYMQLTILTSIMVSVSFIAGVPFGIEGVAYAYTTANLLIMIPLIHYGFKGTPLTLKVILQAVKGPIIAAAFAGVVVYGVRTVVIDDSIVSHVLMGLIFFLIYTAITLSRTTTRDTLKSIWTSISGKD